MSDSEEFITEVCEIRKGPLVCVACQDGEKKQSFYLLPPKQGSLK